MVVEGRDGCHCFGCVLTFLVLVLCRSFVFWCCVFVVFLCCVFVLCCSLFFCFVNIDTQLRAFDGCRQLDAAHNLKYIMGHTNDNR